MSISSLSEGRSSSSSDEEDNLVKQFEENRRQTAHSVLAFPFNKKRVRVISTSQTVPDDSNGIVYWMSRDCRVQDNWAFLFAQKLALKNQLPLYVCFCLVPKYLDATLRQYKFMLGGLKEVERECIELKISFKLLIGCATEEIPKFVNKYKIGAVVCDFSPLRISLQWLDGVSLAIPATIPLVVVDAHNITPVWITSDKQEYAARTIRQKINGNLTNFLTDFPPVTRHPYECPFETKPVDWNKAFESLDVDVTVDEVDWIKPGYKNAVRKLENFCRKTLEIFHNKRNDPLANAISNLSPWFHFGQISVQRAVKTVNSHDNRCAISIATFCEEAIVRRELSDNFCHYNKNYDSLDGLANWAKQTLNDHRNDKREWIYSKEELEESKTHDDLWNSAQIQLCKEGKMHGFLRMYWAKKILEWTRSPEEALHIALYLNDKYSLDGHDPNGYVGCMWSIGGIHDQAWKERPVFGKIRYMNYKGCERKFDVKGFVAKYGGKVYNNRKHK